MLFTAASSEMNFTPATVEMPEKAFEKLTHTTIAQLLVHMRKSNIQPDPVVQMSGKLPS